MTAGDAGARLADSIRAQARGLGFEPVGFARAEAHGHGANLRKWLDAGRNGSMAWMARSPERRADPRLVLREARTVISLGLNYFRGNWPVERPDALRGRIARYAWGRDYHGRIRRRLRRLAREIVEHAPDARWAAYVDTGPVLERAWAERSGIGWIGKNTNVIVKGGGSWIFVCEIVTDLALAPDPPSRNYCGRCTRCIPACPTGAIVEPYVLDARRCISYLTIEHRGAIPTSLRPAIGARIFGCDDCQEACPWNRFAVKTEDPEFIEREGQQVPDLTRLLALNDAAFRHRYRGTALMRAGRARFARNVAVALGNLRDTRAVPPLVAMLEHDPSPLARGHAAWALGRIGGAEARRALLARSAVEEDPEARREIDYARGVPALERGTNHRVHPDDQRRNDP